MSTRQLRKLQKQRELEKAQEIAAVEEESSDDGDEVPVAAKPRVSLFAALGGEDEDEVEDEPEDEQDVVPEPEPVKEVVLTTGKSRKKKKKKKGKAPTVTATTTKDDDAEEDEIDRAIKELNIKTSRGESEAGLKSEAETMRRLNTLLKINPYHLKAVNEMRNLFGRDIIESAAQEEESEERNRRRRGAPAQTQVDLETFLRTYPGVKKLPEISLRRNVFIQGREHWPAATASGLTMREVDKAKDGSWTEYAYFHEGQYDTVQKFFFGCVQIGDPMRMVHLLKEVPYHISTLLQVSSIAKQDQNMALAAELCERALFTFGRMTTSAFRQNIEQGKARLDFRRPENRQFWLAGYHYLKSLIRKGTYRTALEWAKLLYTLDPKDPYAMRHFIHFLAVRAHESGWLVEFLDEMESASDNRDIIYLRQTLVLAKLQVGDMDGARADLAMGMKRVPWLYCALFQELGLDAPPSIWGISANTSSREFWVKLYIYQTKDLWNNTQATDLLKEVAKSIPKVSTAELPNDDPPADLGTTRLVYLEGQTSLLVLAPRDLLDRQPNYEFDPLPPPEEDNIFTGEGAQMPWRERRGQNEAGSSTEIEARMRNLFARQAAAAQAGVGGWGGGNGGVPVPGAGGVLFDDDDDDSLEGEAPIFDSEDEAELRGYLDVGEQASQGNAGVIATLMQMLGGGPPAYWGVEGNEEDADERDLDAYIAEASVGPPGAWPDEDDSRDGGGGGGGGGDGGGDGGDSSSRPAEQSHSP